MNFPLNHREALEEIAKACTQSRTYTRRTQYIHEVAMKALGMTAGQRMQRHMAVFDKTKEEEARERFMQRAAKQARRDDALRAKHGSNYIEKI